MLSLCCSPDPPESTTVAFFKTRGQFLDTAVAVTFLLRTCSLWTAARGEFMAGAAVGGCGMEVFGDPKWGDWSCTNLINLWKKTLTWKLMIIRKFSFLAETDDIFCLSLTHIQSLHVLLNLAQGDAVKFLSVRAVGQVGGTTSWQWVKCSICPASNLLPWQFGGVWMPLFFKK